jgi:hypothetical protein
MKRFFPELSDEERAEFNEQVRQDIKNPQYHLYCDMYNLCRSWTDSKVLYNREKGRRHLLNVKAEEPEFFSICCCYSSIIWKLVNCSIRAYFGIRIHAIEVGSEVSEPALNICRDWMAKIGNPPHSPTSSRNYFERWHLARAHPFYSLHGVYYIHTCCINAILDSFTSHQSHFSQKERNRYSTIRLILHPQSNTATNTVSNRSTFLISFPFRNNTKVPFLFLSSQLSTETVAVTHSRIRVQQRKQNPHR